MNLMEFFAVSAGFFSNMVTLGSCGFFYACMSACLYICHLLASSSGYMLFIS